MRRLLFIFVVIAAATAAAQRGGGGHLGGRGSSSFAHARRASRGNASALGLFDPLYSDFVSGDGQAAPAMPWQNTFTPPPPPATPLMIELRGDRYIQVSGDEPSTARVIDAVQTPPSSQTRAQTASRATTILVFRDGHREEIADYTIAQGTLYASADFYSSGAWNRKIDLSTVNVAETTSSNQSRGIAFRVPSAPNEVIVGP